MGRTTGVRFPTGAVIFFSLQLRLDRLWGSPSLLSSGYWELLRWGKSCRAVNLTTHLHLLPILRMCGAIPSLPPY